MFILTSVTLPLASATAFSSTGASCLHGPHQGAQKSTSTGCLSDAFNTSALKLAVVTSLTLLGCAKRLLSHDSRSLARPPGGGAP